MHVYAVIKTGIKKKTEEDKHEDRERERQRKRDREREKGSCHIHSFVQASVFPCINTSRSVSCLLVLLPVPFLRILVTVMPETGHGLRLL